MSLLSRRATIAGLGTALVTPSKAAKQLCAAVADAPSGPSGGPVCSPTVNPVALVQINGSYRGLSSIGSTGFVYSPPYQYLVHSVWHCFSFSPTQGSGLGFAGPFMGLELAGDPTGVSGHCHIGLADPTLPTNTTFYDGTFITPGGMVHTIISVNCVSQVVQVYCNDMPFTISSGAGWTQPGSLRGPQYPGSQINEINLVGTLTGSIYPAMAELWQAATPSFVDLSIVSNRRKFINANLTAVDLGADGSIPFGFQPQLYLTAKTSDPNDLCYNYGTSKATDQPWGANAGITLTFQAPGTCPCP